MRLSIEKPKTNKPTEPFLNEPCATQVTETYLVGSTVVGGHLCDSKLKELLPRLPVIYVKAVAVQPTWEPSAVGYLRHQPDTYEAPVSHPPTHPSIHPIIHPVCYPAILRPSPRFDLPIQGEAGRLLGRMSFDHPTIHPSIPTACEGEEAWLAFVVVVVVVSAHGVSCCCHGAH
jgi:hypothetical protein